MSQLRVLSRERVFDHPWERIFIERVQTENGKDFDYLISEPNDFVIVVPFLPDGEVLLVEQYKHGAQKDLILGGGTLCARLGELFRKHTVQPGQFYTDNLRQGGSYD